MDIGRAFGVPFKDESWLAKTALGALWGLLGVTQPALTGYQLDYTKAVAEGNELPLPDWSDFGRLWVRGFLASVAMFVYFLPAVILGAIGLLPLIASSVNGGGESLALGTMCFTNFLMVVYILGVTVFTQAALTNYAMREDFGSLFAFGDIISRIKTPNSGYFTAWGMGLVFALGASTVGSIVSATGIGAIIMFWPIFVAQIMSAHLLGQYAAVAYQRPGLSTTGSTGAGAVYAPAPPMAPRPPAAPVAPAPPAAPTPPAPAAPAPPAPPAAPAPPAPPVPPAPTSAPTPPAPPTAD